VRPGAGRISSLNEIIDDDPGQPCHDRGTPTYAIGFSHPLGRFDLGDAKWFKELLQQHFPLMCRRLVGKMCKGACYLMRWVVDRGKSGSQP
jgi:hypothetical protein